MAKRLVTLLNRVLVEKIVPPSKTIAGILLPKKSSKLNSGKVVAVGPGSRDKVGNVIPVVVEEGDTVLLPEYGGIEIFSRHTSNEVYLGKRDNPEWTKDDQPLVTFDRFGKKLEEIKEKIVVMNNDEKLKNRVGPVKVPYTLLYPTNEVGLTGKEFPTVWQSKLF